MLLSRSSLKCLPCRQATLRLSGHSQGGRFRFGFGRFRPCLFGRFGRFRPCLLGRFPFGRFRFGRFGRFG